MHESWKWPSAAYLNRAELRPDNSDVNLFSYCERVIDLDPEISDGALDFRAAQQKLNGAQVTRASVDEGRLCST
jgi:hypothetical protein